MTILPPKIEFGLNYHPIVYDPATTLSPEAISTHPAPV